jgi:hypothetical protein
MTYLTETQIDDMAHAAYETFMVSGERRDMPRVAAEYAADEFGVTPRKSAVLLAVKRANLMYEAARLR